MLKAPFCVHPKTGRVCVPVDPADIDQFDPHGVPTVTRLLRELDVAGEGADWEKTSLKPYVEMMDKHTMGLMEDVRRAKRTNYHGGSDDYLVHSCDLTCVMDRWWMVIWFAPGSFAVRACAFVTGMKHCHPH